MKKWIFSILTFTLLLKCPVFAQGFSIIGRLANPNYDAERAYQLMQQRTYYHILNNDGQFFPDYNDYPDQDSQDDDDVDQQDDSPEFNNEQSY